MQGAAPPCTSLDSRSLGLNPLPYCEGTHFLSRAHACTGLQYHGWFRARCLKSSLCLAPQAVADVKAWAASRLPEGPTLYPKKIVSEQPERFFVAELIRERIFLLYEQEVPYSVQVGYT